MTAPSGGNVQLSQGYEVLPPKSGQAYPILCGDWDALKEKVRQVSQSPWVFHTVGSILVGCALSTFVTILLGNFAAGSIRLVLAWAVVVVAALCGSASLFFSHQQRKLQQVQLSHVLSEMENLENRYERGGV